MIWADPSITNTTTPLAIALDIPFHAVVSSTNHTSWICKQGFYKTMPANPLLSTCKKCSSFGSSNCSQDSRPVECTPLRDAACEVCPALPSGWIYTPNVHDCKTKQCDAGYFNKSSIDCLPCPFGSYCQNGIATECGKGLITFTQATVSPLQCVAIEFDAVQQIQITLFFTIQYDSSFLSSFTFCPKREQVISSWMQYGRLLECSTVQGANSDNLNEFQINCVIFSSKAFFRQFIVWLYEAIEIQNDWMKDFIGKCISQEQGKIITSWYIRILDMPTDTMYASLFNSNSSTVSLGSSISIENSLLNNKTINPSSYAPRLYRIIPKWGKSGQDIATLVFVLCALGSAMCISIFLLISGAILRLRKGWKLKAMHELQTTQIKNTLL